MAVCANHLPIIANENHKRQKKKKRVKKEEKVVHKVRKERNAHAPRTL